MRFAQCTAGRGAPPTEGWSRGVASPVISSLSSSSSLVFSHRLSFSPLSRLFFSFSLLFFLLDSCRFSSKRGKNQTLFAANSLNTDTEEPVVAYGHLS